MTYFLERKSSANANLPSLSNIMDMNKEREMCVDNMGDTLFQVMEEHIKCGQNDNAIAICEEWLVDGKDPQDDDTEFIFMNNLYI